MTLRAGTTHDGGVGGGHRTDHEERRLHPASREGVEDDGCAFLFGPSSKVRRT
jgi:hypothetical protein